MCKLFGMLKIVQRARLVVLQSGTWRAVDGAGLAGEAFIHAPRWTLRWTLLSLVEEYTVPPPQIRCRCERRNEALAIRDATEVPPTNDGGARGRVVWTETRLLIPRPPPLINASISFA